MVTPIPTHKNWESTWGDSVRPQGQGCTSSGWCEVCSAPSFLFPTRKQSEACGVRWSPQRGPLLLYQEHPREVVSLRHHPGVATQERALPCCVWPLCGIVSVLNSRVDGLLYADSTAVPGSLLHSCLPLQSCLQGLAEGLAAWLCYPAVVQVDICLLRGMWHHAHITSFYLQCHLGWWDY